MKVNPTRKYTFDDVLIKPNKSTVSSRSQASVHRFFSFRWTSRTWYGFPIVAANMDATGTFDMAREMFVHRALVAMHKHNSTSDWALFAKENRVTAEEATMVTTGIADGDYERLRDVLEVSPRTPFVCIDVANGYMTKLAEFVTKVRVNFPDRIIVAGNVVTSEATRDLINVGADIVKVGIGPGSACTTRAKTGVGYPQLSAIIECAETAHILDAHIMADGGCKTPGDIAKAFGAGADFVMIGSMLAATEESAAEQVQRMDGVACKRFYGMSSATAMNKYNGGVDSYRTAEGADLLLPITGTVEDVMLDIAGGLRSACSYVGALRLSEFCEKVSFVTIR